MRHDWVGNGGDANVKRETIGIVRAQAKSYFEGVDPRLSHPQNGYRVDTEQLTAQFVWSDGAEAATVDGGRYTLKVVCHGACAGEAPTRSLELVHQGGKWLVDTFADVLEPVVQPLCCFAHRLHFVLG
jgi:hypothetical protein